LISHVTTALRRDMTKVQVQTVFNARSIVVTSHQSSLPLYHTTSKINKKKHWTDKTETKGKLKKIRKSVRKSVSSFHGTS